MPSRVEKEPMRNLYMYYKRIKIAIVKKQQALAAGGQTDNMQPSNAANKRSTSVASADSNVTSGSRAISTDSAPANLRPVEGNSDDEELDKGDTTEESKNSNASTTAEEKKRIF